MNNNDLKKIIRALEEHKDTLKVIKDHVEHIPKTGKNLTDAGISILNCMQLIKEKMEEKNICKEEKV